MKTTINILIIGFSLSFSASTVYASDANHKGKALHNDKCTSCHTDSVYTRENKMVKTMPALEHQVDNCMKGAAKAEWSKPQTTSVIDYLNDRYYKF